VTGLELQITVLPLFLCTGSSQGLYVPAPKRPRYFEVDIDKDKDQPCPFLISDDEDSEEEFDPESYYATDSGEETPKEVKKFLVLQNLWVNACLNLNGIQ